MNFKLLVNNEEKKVSQITLEKVSQVITTKYPTDGIANAVATLGGQAYLDAFASAGSESDVIEIQHETEKNVYTFAGRALRGVLVTKMTLACNSETWQSELPEREQGEKIAKDKGLPEVI